LKNTVIRHAKADDYKVIIDTVDEWWGGRRMAQMLPKLFFVHFCPTSFVADQDGLIIGFVAGLVSQSYPDEGWDTFTLLECIRAFAKKGWDTSFTSESLKR
jgi:hypothetical protein